MPTTAWRWLTLDLYRAHFIKVRIFTSLLFFFFDRFRGIFFYNFTDITRISRTFLKLKPCLFRCKSTIEGGGGGIANLGKLHSVAMTLKWKLILRRLLETPLIVLADIDNGLFLKLKIEELPNKFSESLSNGSWRYTMNRLVD